MQKILVTGGCGYIGSHSIVDLIQQGYDVISIDNLSRGKLEALDGIEKITGRRIKNYAVDLCNLDESIAVFNENPGIAGIIHFAAYKEVKESEQQPLLYFHNNLASLVNILQCAIDFKIPHFIFSSSCTVYGNPDEQCVTEDTGQKAAASAYGSTKQIGEEMVQKIAATYANQFAACLLRYFNPVGAHPSNELGEYPTATPANLVPNITQTAIGKRPQMSVFGTDYPTRDGSCLRDFIHVSDIAMAHTQALAYLQNRPAGTCEIFNLGSGNGITVLESIAAFEKVSGVSLNYTTTARREGDVEAIYANNNKAVTELGWQPKHNLEDMMHTAWEWEKKLNKQIDN